MGIEWEFGGRTGVVAVERVEPGDAMASGNDKHDLLVLRDPLRSTAQRMVCVDPGSGGYPLVSFTYDMGLPETGFADRTLEVVTGPLAVGSSDWLKVLGHVEMFFDALRGTCKPKRYRAVGTKDNEVHTEVGVICYASAADVIANMKRMASARGATLSVEDQTRCNGKPLLTSYEAGFYLTYRDDGRATFLDTPFFDSATPQVNLAISLEDFAEKDLSFLFTAGSSNVALAGYTRARESAKGVVPPLLRAFFVLYGYNLTAGVMNELRAHADLDDEADRKNRFDLFLKTTLGEVYTYVTGKIDPMTRDAQPFVISNSDLQHGDINRAFCVGKFTSPAYGAPTDAPYCREYTAVKIGKYALDEPKTGRPIADWNKAILAGGDPIKVAKPAKMIGDRVLVEVRSSGHPLNVAAKLSHSWEGLRLADPAKLGDLLRDLR
jgi:hypothetical protein